MSNENSKLDIRRIYLKDFSFESPQSPQSIDNPKVNPTIDINLGVRYRQLDDEGFYEIVLSVTATANADNATVFLAEVQQAGLFRIEGFSGEDMELVLNVAGPTILLPFARAAITDVVSKGGFPQLLISPVNFEVLYNNRKKQEQAQATDSNGAKLN